MKGTSTLEELCDVFAPQLAAGLCSIRFTTTPDAIFNQAAVLKELLQAELAIKNGLTRPLKDPNS